MASSTALHGAAQLLSFNLGKYFLLFHLIKVNSVSEYKDLTLSNTIKLRFLVFALNSFSACAECIFFFIFTTKTILDTIGTLIANLI